MKEEFKDLSMTCEEIDNIYNSIKNNGFNKKEEKKDNNDFQVINFCNPVFESPELEIEDLIEMDYLEYSFKRLCFKRRDIRKIYSMVSPIYDYEGHNIYYKKSEIELVLKKLNYGEAIINDFVDYDEQFTARDVFMWGLYKICFQTDKIKCSELLEYSKFFYQNAQLGDRNTKKIAALLLKIYNKSLELDDGKEYYLSDFRTINKEIKGLVNYSLLEEHMSKYGIELPVLEKPKKKSWWQKRTKKQKKGIILGGIVASAVVSAFGMFHKEAKKDTNVPFITVDDEFLEENTIEDNFIKEEKISTNIVEEVKEDNNIENRYIEIGENVDITSEAEVYTNINDLVNCENAYVSYYGSNPSLDRKVESVSLQKDESVIKSYDKDEINNYLDSGYDVIGYGLSNMYGSNEGLYQDEDVMRLTLKK